MFMEVYTFKVNNARTGSSFGTFLQNIFCYSSRTLIVVCAYRVLMSVQSNVIFELEVDTQGLL